MNEIEQEMIAPTRRDILTYNKTIEKLKSGEKNTWRNNGAHILNSKKDGGLLCII